MTWAELLAGPALVAILRGITAAEAPDIAEVLFEAGLRGVEVTLNSERPLESIAAIRARLDGRMLVGAGTVLAPHEVAEAAAAGAQFVVSPDAKPAVISATKAAGLVSLPGVFTPGEAFTALDAGADALKLFPAEAASPAVLKALRAVLPVGTAILPVGGIAAASMAPWRAAGAAGFGIGGTLYRPGMTPEAVRARAEEFVAAWRALP